MKGILLLSLLVLASCASKKVIESPPVVVELPPITVEVPTNPNTDFLKAQIVLMAATSEAARINWKDRGVAPKGYVKGMALVYARAYCEKSPLLNTGANSPDKDALAYLGISASLRNTYVLLYGLGMRESSGKHCVGRDTTASNTSATSAEAGAFQTSYDSSGADASLPKMLANWSTRECYGGAFAEGVTCSASNWKSYGSGVGFKFQEMAKSCPAFAAEYAAVTVRKLRKHYGPINRKEVQFKQEVVDLFADIEKVVDANPSLCSAL